MLNQVQHDEALLDAELLHRTSYPPRSELMICLLAGPGEELTPQGPPLQPDRNNPPASAAASRKQAVYFFIMTPPYLLYTWSGSKMFSAMISRLPSAAMRR